MIKITVCLGSSCHLKGARTVVEQLQYLIATNKVGDKVDLGGAFCMGVCQEAVCVTVDGEVFSVAPHAVAEFFGEKVLSKLQ